MRLKLYMFVFIIFYICSAYTQDSGQMISIPEADPGPWNHLKVNTAADQFQFAIVSDRTGGMRPGVFARAVDKLNLLQPEFVMSVGDLIEGYTEDETQMTEEWNDFDEIISRLEPPFFYIPGNHDITNEKLDEKWRERYGRSYYHFTYKGVLFLCMDTEDGAGSRMGKQQIAYFDSVLASHDNSRWIMIFMHRPLWDYGDKGGFEPIEQKLAGKKYTLFSGHHHNYLYDKRNGKDHFILATTGGGSQLRGARFGELDHIVWVTMKESGPVIANIALDGIMNKEIVTREVYPEVEVLRNGTWFRIKPVVHPEASFNTLTTRLRFKNPSDKPLSVKGTLGSVPGLAFQPDEIDKTVAAKSEEDVNLLVRSRHDPVDIAELQPLRFELTGSYGPGFALPETKELILDWIHTCSDAPGTIQIDGNLKEWDAVPFIEVKRPQYFQEGWDWHGPEDGWFRFAVASDGRFLYLAMQSFDEKILVSEEGATGNQDRFYVHLDPGYNAMETSPEKADSWLRYQVSAAGDGEKIEYRFTPTEGGILAECAIPVDKRFYRDDKLTFRMNIGYMDFDNPKGTKPSILWWRPLWDRSANYAGSGVFRSGAEK